MNNTSRLTYHTVRWLFFQKRQNELLACKTKDDIKALIWKYMKPLGEPSESFKKGAQYIDYHDILLFIQAYGQQAISK